MSSYYTITGKETTQTYLVRVDDGRTWLYPPGTFKLPWTGQSGHQYGLSWTPNARRELRGSPRIAGWRSRRLVARAERKARRARRRRERGDAYAARQRGGSRG